MEEMNPSFEIVSRLPGSIRPKTGSDVSSILIHKHPEPVKVSYKEVYELVPELYRSMPNVEYFVHVGVHGGIQQSRLERQARKGPYRKLDVDGRTFADEFGDHEGLWEDAPRVLETKTDVDGIVERMLGRGWDVEESDSPGLYLCEFIYYNSLLEGERLEKEGRSLKGIFVHVPPSLSEEALDKQRDTVREMIREMVG